MLDRIDIYPTHRRRRWLRPGGRSRLARPSSRGINFAVFSRHAIRCIARPVSQGRGAASSIIPFPDAFRIGNVWAMIVFGIETRIQYGGSAWMALPPLRQPTARRHNILLDPARAIGGRRLEPGQRRGTTRWSFAGRCSSMTSTGRTTASWDSGRGPDHLRDARARVPRHESSGAKFPGTLCRHPRKSLPAGVGRQRR